MLLTLSYIIIGIYWYLRECGLFQNEVEAVSVRAEGDRGEMDILKDRIVALERQLSKAELQNQHLSQQLLHKQLDDR